MRAFGNLPPWKGRGLVDAGMQDRRLRDDLNGTWILEDNAVVGAFAVYAVKYVGELHGDGAPAALREKRGMVEPRRQPIGQRWMGAVHVNLGRPALLVQGSPDSGSTADPCPPEHARVHWNLNLLDAR